MGADVNGRPGGSKTYASAIRSGKFTPPCGHGRRWRGSDDGSHDLTLGETGAEQVGALVALGGRFYLHDGHPVAWALADDRPVIEYTYFEETEPFVDDSEDTYADGDRAIEHNRTYEWNHGIGET